MSTSLVSFSFDSLSVRTFADEAGEPWFCAKDVCDVLGYANSRKTVADHCRAKGVANRDTPTESDVTNGDGTSRARLSQEMTFINEGNLYRLIIKSRKPEAERFESWVCDEVLPTIRKTGQYIAPKFRPEKTRKALPGGLTVEQQDAIKALVKSRVEILPQGAQAKAAITCWSAVKSKFGVSYKEVPATNFPDVLSLVARLPLDGELLKAPKGKYHFPLSFWQPTNRAGRSGWLTWDELTRIESSDLPLSNLLSRLAADGHDVEGARVEYRAMRLLLESMHWTIADIAARVNAIPRRGLSVAF